MRAPRARIAWWVAVAVVGAVALTSTACATSESSWGGEVVDSAGVALVHNPDEGLWEGDAWSVERELVVGSDPTRPETDFGYVADVAIDGAGRLYVLDQQAQEVRVFDADGGTVGRIGEPGEGPGGLSRFAASLVLSGDTLAVADWGRARLHRFLLDGTFLDAPPLPVRTGARSWWRRGTDGVLRFRALTRVVRDDGRWGGDDHLYEVAPDLSAADSVFAFVYPEADLGARGAPRLPLVVNAPSWDVAADGGVVWTTLEGARVHRHDPDGSVRWIATRGAWLTPAPSAADERALIEAMGDKLVLLGGDRGAVESLEVEYPARLPGITTVRVGLEGTIWLQRMGDVSDVHPMALNAPDPPLGWGGARWDVLDGGGRYLGTVDLPARFRVARFVDDVIVGVATDEVGVDRVVRLRVVRGGG